MASRENQGYKIALIILTMVTVILIGVTYWLFKTNDEAETKLRTYENDLKTAQKAAKDAFIAEEDFRKILGFSSKDSLDAVQKKYKEDMAKYGASIPEAKQNYQNLAEYLYVQLHDANGRLADGEVRYKESQAKIKTDETAHVAAVKAYEDGAAKNTADSESEREKFNKDREDIKGQNGALAKNFEAKRAEFDGAIKKLSDDLQKTLEALTGYKKINDKINDELRGRTVSAEVSDGKITWVNQRDRTVWLNVGSDDGMHRQVTFAVVGQEETNPATAPRKGSVEVTRIIERHLSEARIVDDDPTNPILPGDQIFSDAWSPGQAESFALAGFMDIDNDGESDRKRMHDLIALNGGKVDAELTDAGKRVGEMVVGTRFLVLGEHPRGQRATAEYLKNYSRMTDDAEKLGVKTIPLREFLDRMGYVPLDKTIPLGEKARPEDFKPRLPEGVQRKSVGSTFDFKPRTVPGAAAAAANPKPKDEEPAPAPKKADKP